MDLSLKNTFGIIELVFGALIGILFAYLQDRYGSGNHLNDYYFKLFMISYVGVFFGVVISGLFYLFIIKKLSRIYKAILYTALGILVGLLFYILAAAVGSMIIPYGLIAWFLPLILPLIGAVIGFNLSIKKEKPPLY